MYNGWSNYETWNVALWWGNDPGGYGDYTEAAQEAWDAAEAGNGLTREESAANALAEWLKNATMDGAPELGASMYADLLGAALSEVNWHEIAESWLEDVDRDGDT